VTEALRESQAEELETAAMYESTPEPAVAVALSATHPLAADQPDISSDASSGATVPQDIQKHILAQVHYPMQARRRGWQGRAEFQLNVYQQSIHAVTLLASTGHPILDRAARRGLTSMRQIPLSNGLYRMPVVFRLQ
jgi:TonB family protein